LAAAPQITAYGLGQPLHTLSRTGWQSHQLSVTWLPIPDPSPFDAVAAEQLGIGFPKLEDAELPDLGFANGKRQLLLGGLVGAYVEL
jgi:hypothetical protein